MPGPHSEFTLGPFRKDFVRRRTKSLRNGLLIRIEGTFLKFHKIVTGGAFQNPPLFHLFTLSTNIFDTHYYILFGSSKDCSYIFII